MSKDVHGIGGLVRLLEEFTPSFWSGQKVKVVQREKKTTARKKIRN